MTALSFICFSRKHLWKVLKPSVILFACFLTAIIVCICHCFRWMSWLLRVRASQLVHSTLSSFFAWCRAQVCRSGWKDICTRQVVQYTQTDTIRERQFANRYTGSRFSVNRKSDEPSLIRWKCIPEVNLQDTCSTRLKSKIIVTVRIGNKSPFGMSSVKMIIRLR